MRVTGRSGGNVFEDLGLPDAPDLLRKAELVRDIAEIIRRRGLAQAEAAREMGIDQPKVSALLRGRFEGYTIDRLIRFLDALNYEVRLSVRPKLRPR